MKATLITHALAALLIVCGACAQSQIESSESEGPYATAAAGTPLEQMKLAEVSGKIGVPVEVRYLLSGEPVRDQLMGFELAVACGKV